MTCPNCADHNPHAAASAFFRENAFCDGPDEFATTCPDCGTTWTFLKCTTCDGDGQTGTPCGDGCCMNMSSCNHCDGNGWENLGRRSA